MELTRYAGTTILSAEASTSHLAQYWRLFDFFNHAKAELPSSGNFYNANRVLCAAMSVC
jgi:hypothetical protein